MKKIFTGTIVAIFLSGCAFSDYEGTAKRAALANVCEQEGFISYKEFAYYTSFQMGEYAHQHMNQVDDNKLYSMYQEQVEKINRYDLKSPTNWEDLRTVCAHIAVVAERVRPQNSYQAQQQESFLSSLNQNENSTRQAGGQALQQANSPPPSVTPMSITPLGGNKVRNCWTASGIEYCK